MGSLSFSLLGPTRVVADAAEITIHGSVRRRLLIRLLIARNRPVPVERLREDLWEGRPPPSAASTLKSHLSLLRRVLGADRLAFVDGAYLLRVEPDELDAAIFEAEASRGRVLLRSGDMRGAAEELTAALARWRGRALEDAAGASWAAPEAVRLEELRAAALESWLEARMALGEHHEVVAEAEAAIAEYPLREALWARLITALYAIGRQADALRAYQRLRELLLEELGLEPSPELVALERAVLKQELAATPAGASLPDGAPEEAAASRHNGRRSNLPPDLTSFVPRPSELAQLGALLEAPNLVTLTGAGGTGKTRLAIRAAKEAETDYDAVWLCELASLDDPALVRHELAAAIGCSEHPGVELSQTITTRLAEGRQLLILDNCEHLLEASAALAHELRKAAPRLRLLATSRSPLGVEGEIVYRVPSMSVPGDPTDPKMLLDYESVRLLVERAQSQQPAFTIDDDNFRSVAAVCTRLDGIPLALELAAARLRTMSVTDLERRLDDRFHLLTGGLRTAAPRQQTLEALIDWSYDLLNEYEHDALGRLTVFSGGFDLGAAETVVPEGHAPVHDVIASLVDKSLIQLDTASLTARYRMLETVRAYAAAKTPSADLNEAREAHAAYFLGRAEAAAPHFSSGDQLEWRARMEADDDNLRTAFAFLVEAPDPGPALRFSAVISRYWNSRGVYGSEIDLVECALDRTDAGAPTEPRGAALAAAGYLLFRRGETSGATVRLDEALRIARALGSAALAADALRTMAWVADRRGAKTDAEDLAAEAVTEALRSGEAHLIARAYEVRAAATQYRDPDQARADYAEALRYCRASGDAQGQVGFLNNLAVLEVEQGHHQRARAYFAEALEAAEAIRDTALIPFLEYGLALAAALEEDYQAAEPAFANALAAARRTGQRSLVAYAILGIAVTRALSVPTTSAALLLGAARTMFEELGELPEQTESTLEQRAEESLRRELGQDLVTQLEAGGRLGIEQVLRLVSDL